MTDITDRLEVTEADGRPLPLHELRVEAAAEIRRLRQRVAELERDIAGYQHDNGRLISARIQAYRGALGYQVPGEFGERLSDGTVPNNGIAKAVQAENSRLRAALAELEAGWQRTYDYDVSKLRAALAAAERDAARYRELRSRAKQNTAYDVYGDGGCWSIGFHSPDNRLSFDAATDAAMQEMKP